MNFILNGKGLNKIYEKVQRDKGPKVQRENATLLEYVLFDKCALGAACLFLPLDPVAYPLDLFIFSRILTS